MTAEELEKILLDPTTEVSGATLAGLSDCTVRTITELARQRVVVRTKRGRFLLRQSLENYMRDLRDAAAGRAEAENCPERLRLTTARANLAELDLAERVGAVIPTRTVVDIVAQAVGNMKVRLLAIPTKVAPRLLKITNPRDAKTILDREIERALTELSSLDALSRPVAIEQDRA
jgi:phage terminase Nu1 subunit (DNA packaging protein)